jgi:hypothetical protein
VLVAVVPLAGLLATIRLVPRVLASGIALDSDASALGIGVSGSVVGFLSGVVWANLGAALTFAVLGWAGILLRRRTAVHKRLMLLATISILGPALARLARLAIFGGEDGPFVPMVLLALLIAVVIHDAITMKRIHPATILGAVFAIGVNVVTGLIAPTDMGLSLARWLQ